MRRYFNAFCCYYFAIVLSIFLVVACAGIPVDDVVARVNGKDITRQDLNVFMRTFYLFRPELQDIYNREEEVDPFETEMLWLLIENTLLEQELERLSLETDSEEVEHVFQQLREDLLTFVYETEAEYLERLQELQLDEDQLKNLSHSTLMQELLFQHVCATVTEADARAYVQENPYLLEQPANAYVFRILLASEDEALQVRRLLEQGADFVETGEKYSLEGFVELGQIKESDIFDPFFIEAVFQLEPGELSWPVETPQGYFIIMITEKEEAVTLDFAQARDEIMTIVQEESYEKYFYRLLQESKIETFLEVN